MQSAHAPKSGHNNGTIRIGESYQASIPEYQSISPSTINSDRNKENDLRGLQSTLDDGCVHNLEKSQTQDVQDYLSLVKRLLRIHEEESPEMAYQIEELALEHLHKVNYDTQRAIFILLSYHDVNQDEDIENFASLEKDNEYHLCGPDQWNDNVRDAAFSFPMENLKSWNQKQQEQSTKSMKTIGNWSDWINMAKKILRSTSLTSGSSSYSFQDLIWLDEEGQELLRQMPDSKDGKDPFWKEVTNKFYQLQKRIKDIRLWVATCHTLVSSGSFMAEEINAMERLVREGATLFGIVHVLEHTVLEKMMNEIVEWKNRCKYGIENESSLLSLKSLMAEGVRLNCTSLPEMKLVEAKFVQAAAMIQEIKMVVAAEKSRKEQRLTLGKISSLLDKVATAKVAVPGDQIKQLRHVYDMGKKWLGQYQSILNQPCSLNDLKSLLSNVDILPVDLTDEVKTLKDKQCLAKSWILEVRKSIPASNNKTRGGRGSKIELSSAQQMLESSPGLKDTVELTRIQIIIDEAQDWIERLNEAVKEEEAINLDLIQLLYEEGSNFSISMPELEYLEIEIEIQEWRCQVQKAFDELQPKRPFLNELLKYKNQIETIRKELLPNMGPKHKKLSGRHFREEEQVNEAINSALTWFKHVNYCIEKKQALNHIFSDAEDDERKIITSCHENGSRDTRFTLSEFQDVLNQATSLPLNLEKHINLLQPILENYLNFEEELQVFMDQIKSNHANHVGTPMPGANQLLEKLNTIPIQFPGGRALEKLVQTSLDWEKEARRICPKRQIRGRRQLKQEQEYAKPSEAQLKQLLDGIPGLFFSIEEDIVVSLHEEQKNTLEWKNKFKLTMTKFPSMLHHFDAINVYLEKLSPSSSKAKVDMLSSIKAKEKQMQEHVFPNATTSINSTSTNHAQILDHSDDADRNSITSLPSSLGKLPMDKATVGIIAKQSEQQSQTVATAPFSLSVNGPSIIQSIYQALGLQKLLQKRKDGDSSVKLLNGHHNERPDIVKRRKALCQCICRELQSSAYLIEQVISMDVPTKIDDALHSHTAFKVVDEFENEIKDLYVQGAELHTVPEEMDSLALLLETFQWHQIIRTFIFNYEKWTLAQLQLKIQEGELLDQQLQLDPVFHKSSCSESDDGHLDKLTLRATFYQLLSKIQCQIKEMETWSEQTQSFLNVTTTNMISIDEIIRLYVDGKLFRVQSDILRKFTYEIKKTKAWITFATQFFRPVNPSKDAAHDEDDPRSTGRMEFSNDLKKLKLDAKKLKFVPPKIQHTMQLIGKAEAWEVKVSKALNDTANKTKPKSKTATTKALSSSNNLSAVKMNKLIEEYYQFDFLAEFPNAIQYLENAEAATIKYCACRGVYDGVMIGCDNCSDWFHDVCMGLSSKQVDALENYNCPACSIAKTYQKMIPHFQTTLQSLYALNDSEINVESINTTKFIQTKEKLELEIQQESLHLKKCEEIVQDALKIHARIEDQHATESSLSTSSSTVPPGGLILPQKKIAPSTAEIPALVSIAATSGAPKAAAVPLAAKEHPDIRRIKQVLTTAIGDRESCAARLHQTRVVLKNAIQQHQNELHFASSVKRWIQKIVQVLHSVESYHMPLEFEATAAELSNLAAAPRKRKKSTGKKNVENETTNVMPPPATSTTSSTKSSECSPSTMMMLIGSPSVAIQTLLDEAQELMSSSSRFSRMLQELVQCLSITSWVYWSTRILRGKMPQLNELQWICSVASLHHLSKEEDVGILNPLQIWINRFNDWKNKAKVALKVKPETLEAYDNLDELLTEMNTIPVDGNMRLRFRRLYKANVEDKVGMNKRKKLMSNAGKTQDSNMNKKPKLAEAVVASTGNDATVNRSVSPAPIAGKPDVSLTAAPALLMDVDDPAAKSLMKSYQNIT